MKTFRIILILFVLFISHTCKIPGGTILLSEDVKFNMEKRAFYFQIRNEPFSADLLKKVIEYEKITTPDVVIFQSQLETGFYTSDVFLNGNNLFGMKYPKLRKTVASGEYQGHAKYEHWIDSVIDYKLWQDWYKSVGYRIEGNQNFEYMVFLRCVQYAEDPYYIHKLVRLSEKDVS
jgi:UDP-N-acetylglucosamine pyrophosphorylase